MEITARDYKRVTVVRVTGRVDASTAAQFEAALKEYIAGDHSHLILEMDETDYLSSAGARILISAQKAMRGKGGKVLLAQPSERVREVLQLAGLESIFPVYDDTEAAIGAV